MRVIRGFVLTALLASLGACADPHFNQAVAFRNAVGDRCNVLRDQWRAAMAEGATLEHAAYLRQRMDACVSDFRVAQANLDNMALERRQALQAVGAGMRDLGTGFEAAGAAYGHAADSIRPVPMDAPQPVASGPSLSDQYQRQRTVTVTCVGQIMISGPPDDPGACAR